MSGTLIFGCKFRVKKLHQISDIHVPTLSGSRWQLEYGFEWVGSVLPYVMCYIATRTCCYIAQEKSYRVNKIWAGFPCATQTMTKRVSTA